MGPNPNGLTYSSEWLLFLNDEAKTKNVNYTIQSHSCFLQLESVVGAAILNWWP